MNQNPYNARQELKTAEDEIAGDFGEIFRIYGHDLAILRQLCAIGYQPATIFDVGSSDGIWTATANRVFPNAKFELFEPLAEVSEDYQKTLSSEPAISNLLSTGRVRIHPVALGTENGSCRMTVYPRAVGSTSLELDYAPTNATVVEVPMKSLENFVKEKKLTIPSLLKLDTQGSELDILKGAEPLLPQVDVILCECWLFKGYGSKTPLWLDVANFLATKGFFPYDIGWIYRRPTDQRTATIDLVFLRHDLPFSPLKHEPIEELTQRIVEKQ